MALIPTGPVLPENAWHVDLCSTPPQGGSSSRLAIHKEVVEVLLRAEIHDVNPNHGIRIDGHLQEIPKASRLTAPALHC